MRYVTPNRNQHENNTMKTESDKFLVVVAAEDPTILCKKHTEVIELVSKLNDIEVAIIPIEATDMHCHACDLQVAKAYAKHVAAVEEEQSRPQIILPGAH